MNLENAAVPATCDGAGLATDDLGKALAIIQDTM
jgi:hypothetical protein